MINTNRIVPVMATDLLTLQSRMVVLGGTQIEVLTANDANGNFSVAATPEKPLFASEPVVTLDLASGVTDATVYFAPSYDYTGITVNGEAAEVTGEVEADPGNLYVLTLYNSNLFIDKVGL